MTDFIFSSVCKNEEQWNHLCIQFKNMLLGSAKPSALCCTKWPKLCFTEIYTIFFNMLYLDGGSLSARGIRQSDGEDNLGFWDGRAVVGGATILQLKPGFWFCVSERLHCCNVLELQGHRSVADPDLPGGEQEPHYHDTTVAAKINQNLPPFRSHPLNSYTPKYKISVNQ